MQTSPASPLFPLFPPLITNTHPSILQSAIPPLTFSGLELLGLRRSADTTSESPERDDLLVLGDVVQVGVRLLEVPAWKVSTRVQGAFVVRVGGTVDPSPK